MTDEVAVKSLHWFRGQAGEGDNGMVKPGDTLTVDKRRAAELRANKLVEGGDQVAAQPASPAIAQPLAAAPAAAAPAAGPVKAATLTSETITKPVAPVAPAAPAAPAEVKK